LTNRRDLVEARTAGDVQKQDVFRSQILDQLGFAALS